MSALIRPGVLLTGGLRADGDRVQGGVQQWASMVGSSRRTARLLARARHALLETVARAHSASVGVDLYQARSMSRPTWDTVRRCLGQDLS